MVQYCVAFGYKEKYVKGGSVSFHKFPVNEALRKQWQMSLRRDGFTPSVYSKLCSKHFTEECFDRAKFGCQWLKADAAPTIFVFPAHLQKKAPTRKPPKERVVTPILQKVADDESTLGPSCSEKTPVSRKRCYWYVGDYKEEDLISPTKVKKALDVAKLHIAKQVKHIRKLAAKGRCLKKRIESLNSVLSTLIEKQLISPSAFDTLETTLPGPAIDILRRVVGGSTRKDYPPELRRFALTLHFYSSRAYDYVRKTFNSRLSHPSTLRSWYKVVDGSPGFTAEALVALKMKVQEATSQNKNVFCALSFDEIAIRKHVELDGTSFTGYVDYGTDLDDDRLPYAKEALTFMLNSINGRGKVPIGYFLIDGLSGSERANLVNESLRFVHETGVEVVSLTFDGLNANMVMANILGASIDPSNISPSFKHPVTGKNVSIMLDACHMLKLIRNTWAKYGSLVDSSGGVICWDYVVKLEKFQCGEGLLAATKLRSSHIEWHRKKMKVKLAAQTLSNSVASALEYLESEKVLEFIGCKATINFIRKINDLFDLLNSRNLLSKSYVTIEAL